MSLRGVYRGPHGILCTRGEKEHTSKRVSVIVSDNMISKAKLCDVYTRIFRTPKETSKIHLIFAVFGIVFFHQNSDDFNFGNPAQLRTTSTRPRKNLPRNVKISSKF